MFENAYSQGGWTAQNYASLFTSKYPQSHGLILPSRRLAESELTLAEILRNYGYSTGAFVGGLHTVKEFGFGQGFDVYDDNDNGYAAHMPIKRSISNAKKWIEKRKQNGEKFFAFIHGYDPHCPYQLNEGDLPVFADLEYKSTVDVLKECDRTHYVNATEEDAKHIIDLYDDKIFHADENIGQFLDWLEQEDLFNNSAIIFLSDHGESFKENKARPRIGHVIPLNGVLRMSLIFYAPALKPNRVTHLAELVDVSPTLLELLGIPAGHAFQGKSRLALATGEETDSEEGAVHASLFVIDQNKSYVSLVLATKKWKYVYDVEKKSEELLVSNLIAGNAIAGSDAVFYERLFDFENDKGDNYDLSSSENKIVEQYRGLLGEWWAKTLEKKQVPQDEKWLGPEGYFAN